jgi:hypothetical protein
MGDSKSPTKLTQINVKDQIVVTVDNDSLDWTYGSGYLVLIGDMVDRGTNVVPLLWLIYKLEAQAQLARGNIHYILGSNRLGG